MSSNQFQIVFKGQLEEGFEQTTVKENFAKQFNKKPEEMDVLFSGKAVIFSKNVDLEKARQQAGMFSQLGAIVEIAPMAGGQTSESEDPLKTLAAIRAKEKAGVKRNPVLEFAKSEVKEVDRKSWLRYRFDTFMAKGGASIFKALTATFLISFVLIALLRGLFLYMFPDATLQYENLGFLGNVYVTFLQLTDPGNMAQDILSSPGYKFFSVIAGIAGIIMLSALIAFITTSLDQKISDLKRGRSKVIENDHTLILGWNEQRIVEIIRELIMANESEDDGCVVILADKDKEEMDDALRLNIPKTMTTRLVTRNGNVSNFANLDMVSIERAKSVIILADCNDTDSAEKKSTSDAKAIQTVLATTGLGNESEDFSIIVEIFNPTHREIISATFPENVVTVNTSEILAKLLVQTSRSVGLSVVYNEILSFDGCEMYFYGEDADEWVGRRFGDIAFHFPDGVPIGVRSADGEIVTNPSVDYRMKNDDDILIVADDDSTIEYLENPVAVAKERKLVGGRLPQILERELVLGWNHKSSIILREFADYVKEGSQVHVLLKSPTDAQRAEIESLDAELDELEVKLIEKDRLNRDHLLELRPFEYDNIIILASNDGESDDIDTQQVDSENIVALLLLRSIFDANAKDNKNTKLITEILDSQNYPLVARAGVKDVIISNRLVSMIMAQISESRDIQKVYDDIFQEDGSEIYLKPATLYFKSFPVEVSFADLMAIAQQREEVCIGVKIKSLEDNNDENSGVKLIPLKNERFTLGINDNLVVVAEDEL